MLSDQKFNAFLRGQNKSHLIGNLLNHSTSGRCSEKFHIYAPLFDSPDWDSHSVKSCMKEQPEVFFICNFV